MFGHGYGIIFDLNHQGTNNLLVKKKVVPIIKGVQHS